LHIHKANLNFYGGSLGRDGISFYNSNSSAEFHISGIRDEAVAADYRFFDAPAFTQGLYVDTCSIASVDTFANPMIFVAGGPVTLINNTFAYSSNHTLISFGTSTTSGWGRVLRLRSP
jgi:hypothetical protein